MQGRLTGKTALITGAGSGIGEAMARRFAAEGARVAVLDIAAKEAERVQAAIATEGGDSIAIVADVSDEDRMREAVAQSAGHWGTLDVLVNNAAVQIMGSLHEFDAADFDRTVSVNLRGVFLGCKYALPYMMSQQKGVILSTSSVLGLVGDPDLAVYGAAKGGIIAFTKSLAVAYGKYGIRALSICPGDVNTPLVKAFFDYQPDPEAARGKVYAEYPLKRIAEPDEIARVAAFLASDEASFVTGNSVLVDGGLLSNVY